MKKSLMENLIFCVVIALALNKRLLGEIKYNYKTKSLKTLHTITFSTTNVSKK